VVSEGPVLRELPDSTGQAASAAQTALVELGLTVDVVERYDEEVPAGDVIAWSVPADATLGAGSMVEPGTAVELVVSRGPEPRTVPDLVGRTVDEASAVLGELRVVLVEEERVFSDDVPAGTIIRQPTEPGTQVARDSEVRVVASKGPDLVAFPDISGAATYEEAAGLVRSAGFEPVLVFGDTEGAVRGYTIAGEVPEVGQQYRRGTRVDFEAL
jgi:beta-lactam-binding protein with PASTA domain